MSYLVPGKHPLSHFAIAVEAAEKQDAISENKTIIKCLDYEPDRQAYLAQICQLKSSSRSHFGGVISRNFHSSLTI